MVKGYAMPLKSGTGSVFAITTSIQCHVEVLIVAIGRRKDTEGIQIGGRM